MARKKPPEATIEGVTTARVFAASIRAIGQLGHTVLNSDQAAGTITYNTGFSARSWSGQDMTITILDEGADTVRVIAGGTRAQRGSPLGGGGQLFDWGERAAVAERFFIALDEALAQTRAEAPAPEPAATSATDELERLAALHASGALNDEEFSQAKARVLG